MKNIIREIDNKTGKKAGAGRHQSWIGVALVLVLMTASFFFFGEEKSDTASSKKQQTKNEAGEDGKQGQKVDLGRIIITEKLRKSSAFDTSRPVNVIDSRELADKIPQGMTEVFEGEAGLSVSTTGPNSVRPMIRGLYDDRIRILLNGIRISEQRGGGNHLLSLDPAQVSRVEVIRGPASVLYGSDAIAGVINFIPRQAELNKGNAFRLHGENTTSYESASSGWKNSTILRGGSGRLNFLGQFIYKKSENIQTGEGELGNSFYDGWKSAASLRYALDNGHISGYWYLTKGDIGIPNYNGDRGMDFTKSFFDDEKHNMAVLNFEKNELTPLLESVQFDAAWQEHNRHMNILNPAATNMNVHAEVFLDITTVNLNPHVVLDLGRSHTVNMGINYFYEDAGSGRVFQKEFTDGTVTATPFDGVGVIPDATRSGFGFFVQDEWTPGSTPDKAALVLTPSLRWDTISAESQEESGHPVGASSETDAALSGNLGILVRISEKVNLSLNAGRAFRAPTLLERFFFGPHQAAADQGNPDLVPETSYNIDSGFRFRSETLKAAFSLFYNRVNDYIVSQNTGTTNSLGQDVYSWDNVAEAALYGGELEVEWEPGSGFSVFAIGSLVRGENLTSHENLPAIPPFRADYGLRWRGNIFAGMVLQAELQGRSILEQKYSAPSEDNTPGVTLFGASLGLMVNKYLNVRLRLENIADKAWHDHLSRISWIKEQKGRSFKAAVSLKF